MWEDTFRKVKQTLNNPIKLTGICIYISVYTALVFNIRFFMDVFERVNGGFKGIWIGASMFIIMLALDFCIYYILLFLGRIVGKFIIAMTLLLDALCFYFIINFNITLGPTMIGHVFNTQFSEASSYLSFGMIASSLLGIIPSIWLISQKIDYGKLKGFFVNIGISLAIILGFLAGNRHNVIWIDYCATAPCNKIMPLSYIVNSFRYYRHWKMANQEAVRLPLAEITSDSQDICVLVIGESARRKNFSLYGYDRPTNPLLEKDGVSILNAEAADTYTIEAVKAILSYQPNGKLFEILPNYLERNGIDVIWRSSNWGTPPLNIRKQYTKECLKTRFPEADSEYDGILFNDLKDDILDCGGPKIFIGIHTYTSHGPAYFKNSPQEYKRFFPECQTVEMIEADTSELVNAYDNTILYTDYLLHSVIEMLKSEFPDRRSCVIFISDHGESLGEDGNFMHGIPKDTAPAEQIEIPFIVWTSDSTLKVKDLPDVDQYSIYHSVMNFLGMKSPIYDETKNIFE